MPQLNLYYTDWTLNGLPGEDENVLEHHCLRVPATAYYGANEDYHIISYCMSELPPKVIVENNEFVSKFTFVELFKQNISSEQLYLWSAPMDIIEHYQFYLNQLSTGNDSFLAKEIFYNCTMPRFGPQCQYELYNYHSNHSSLSEIIHNFYSTFKYNPTTLTCYMHLLCNRRPLSGCLDWTEICNGQIDCLNGGLDEEHCWQLEINQCKQNEYRCDNGQCIPQSFFRGNSNNPHCIDGSDELIIPFFIRQQCRTTEPLFICEDMTCKETFFTSSCTVERQNLLLDAIYSHKDNSISEKCWSASKCILQVISSEEIFCKNFCTNNTCLNIILTDCPDILYIPNSPVLFGHVYMYFIYKNNHLQYSTTKHIWIFYVCYATSDYDVFLDMVPKISLDNKTCVAYETVSYPSSSLSYTWGQKYKISLKQLYTKFKKNQLIFNYNSTICNRSNMYQCLNSSKCISTYRLLDTIYDCPYMDDENITVFNNTNIMKQIELTHFKCQTSNKYIAQSLVENIDCNCGLIENTWCDDERRFYSDSKKNISFQTICDGFVELLPIFIDKRNETDETECQAWQCNNIYTHCNNIWHCLNGADEIDCDRSSVSTCPSTGHHLCVSPQTNQLMCLPIEKANDGKIDCLGATDEVILCRPKYEGFHSENFHCVNDTFNPCVHIGALCDDFNDCLDGEDEQFCEKNRTLFIGDGICTIMHSSRQSTVEKFLCDKTAFYMKKQTVYFKLDNMTKSIEYKTKNIENGVLPSSSNIQIPNQLYQSRCHRGLDLRIWINNSTNNTCLCPPSYYGNQCQYQNQRISLTIQFRALSDSYQTPFTIFISLIDGSDKRIIHSYEQITYSSVRDCKTKFNIYLVYSTRPKDSTKQYAIHIDFYEKVSLNYRGSVLLPVMFSFLPVHRLAFIVNIPRSNDTTQICSNDQCIHGQCIKYWNNPDNFTFCKCNTGWSGKYCTIQHTCLCASDSLCIGISANNRSICICSMNKYGSRCLLTDRTCLINDNSTCQHGGQCIFNDDYITSNQTFICICPEGFHGDRCQFNDSKLILSFDPNIMVSQSLFIHFIEVMKEAEPIRSTTFRTIPVRQDSVTIHWSRPFHLVFIETFKNTYYITLIRDIYNESTTINRTISSSERCPNISEVLNATIVQWSLIRRIKYYHLPCQNQSLNLSCFYDDVHLCLCYNFQQQRLANCFNFDHNMTFDCFGENQCENGAQCLVDTPRCPTKSTCICPACYYGRLCQLSTSGFGLSLDAILGYHILPDVHLIHQPSIVKFSLSLTVIFIAIGLFNGIFSMMTFKNKVVREVGCGLYLLGSSITTLLTMIMFGLKFLFLLLAQMAIISNRSFLLSQCRSMDFILRICLCMDQWLNACVATERVIITIKGASFVKKKSRQAAVIVIIILLVVIVGTSIHDPISRRLIDEVNNDDVNDQKRIWCTVSYGPVLQVYNSVMHTVHFVGPFIINLVTTIILITKKTQLELKRQKHLKYKAVLLKQFRQHKNLLAGPIVLVILALPRLILTFISKCMKSPGDSWLFLIGYYISFIPPMLTFVLFVLPSEFYRKEFHKTAAQYRNYTRQLLHLN